MIGSSKSGTTVYNGVDYSAVYNFEYYINKYSDIKTAYGNNPTAALKHFVTYGMKEGRQAISTFNVTSYRYKHQDLRLAYGMDLQKYYLHYMKYGKAEGRNASSEIVMSEESMWKYLQGSIGNSYGVAGLMRNLYAESALKANNLQNAYESTLGYTDVSYTTAVDNGTYTKESFVNDSAGYGLAQWTYWSRKQDLYEYAKAKCVSIANVQMQLEFLVNEMKTAFKTVWTTLVNATSVKEASDSVLTGFEKPADQSDSVKTKRESYGLTYYNKYN